eukprot:TRINITY_DN10194_c0_g1_i1.p1 TRINITY_DN10194_c0_g1~~TRINITY_DN10194_c0_g1_i1.p1  ORF type:complete len:159 (-),score=21.57 TRINITY_DN10194_c0_g1_i1:46-522(-)
MCIRDRSSDALKMLLKAKSRCAYGEQMYEEDIVSEIRDVKEDIRKANEEMIRKHDEPLKESIVNSVKQNGIFGRLKDPRYRGKVVRHLVIISSSTIIGFVINRILLKQKWNSKDSITATFVLGLNTYGLLSSKDIVFRGVYSVCLAFLAYLIRKRLQV